MAYLSIPPSSIVHLQTKDALINTVINCPAFYVEDNGVDQHFVKIDIWGTDHAEPMEQPNVFQ